MSNNSELFLHTVNFLYIVRQLFKGDNYSREETINHQDFLSETTIQGRQLFKGGNYSRKYGIFFFTGVKCHNVGYFGRFPVCLYLSYVSAGRVRDFLGSFLIPTPPLKSDIINGRSLNQVYRFHMKYFLYRGCVNTTMLDILGGLRSACTYVGAGRVKEIFWVIFLSPLPL